MPGSSQELQRDEAESNDPIPDGDDALNCLSKVEGNRMGHSLLPVISALWFLQTRSFYNAARTRLLRLRQPRYLIGAVVGIGYLWMVFFRRFFATHSSMKAGGWNLSPETAGWIEAAAALGLALYVLAIWLFAGDRASLTFSEAEIAFLLPAPASRGALLNFRLLRSQPQLVFSALFFNLFTGRTHSVFEWIAHGFTLWLVFCLLFLHGIGASFAVQRLTERGLSGWRRRLLVLTAAAAVIGTIGWWIYSAADAGPLRSFDDVQGWLRDVFAAGPAPWLLAPFRWVVHPWFSRSLPEFLLALGPAFLVLALHYVWVLRANVSFEEASIEASRKAAATLAAVRSGNLQQLQPPRIRRDPFRLSPVGFPPVALLWKNLIAAGQLYTSRVWIYALVAVVAFAATSTFSAGAINVVQKVRLIVSGMALMFLVISLFTGAQLVRQDFRSDLQQMDMLKTLPMPPWQVVLGQLLAPIVILCAIQWLLLGVAVAGSFGTFTPTRFPIETWRLPVALSLAVILPGINTLVLLLPNAVALLFPAWAGTSQGRGGGIEVMGQRLIFGVGLLLTLLLGLLPALLVGSLVWFLAQLILGPAWALPLAAFPALAVLVLESGVGIWGLAKAFDQYDVTNP